MATVTLKDIRKSYGDVEVIKGVDLADRRPRVLRLRRPVGLRQVHAAAHDRRARGDHRAATCMIDGQRVNDVPPVRARHRHGVPVLRALPAHDGRARTWASRCGSPACPKAERRRARSTRPPRILQLEPAARPQAQGALGRPAPARRHRPRHRARAQGLPVRRAALQPRRRAARADAHRDRPAARRARRDHDLRHPRPGRGDDAGRQDRRAAAPASSSRSARRSSSTTTRTTCSSPASSARPKMNFLPAHGDGRRRARHHRRSLPAARASSRCRSGPAASRPATSVTLGVRPEHLRPAGDRRAHRRGHGGRAARRRDLPLHAARATATMIIVQADGEIPTRVHERIAVQLDPVTCHLFDAQGLADRARQRHPLADIGRADWRRGSRGSPRCISRSTTSRAALALVTGGGQGIGLACVQALAEAGAQGRSSPISLAERAEKARPSCKGKGLAVEGGRVDVTKSAEVDRSRRRARRQDHGGVDILVNNAGIAKQRHAGRGHDRRALAFHIDVNLNGVFWCCRAFGRQMLEKGKGSIVNIGSMSGFIVNKPQPQSFYNASKAAVHHLTRSLAAEWGQRGVRVNAVAPTYIDTPLTRFGMEDRSMYPTWLEMTPMGRVRPAGRDRLDGAVPGLGRREPADRQRSCWPTAATPAGRAAPQPRLRRRPPARTPEVGRVEGRRPTIWSSWCWPRCSASWRSCPPRHAVARR